MDVLAFSLCFSLLALALHPSARGLVPDSGLGTPHSVRVVCVQPFPEWLAEDLFAEGNRGPAHTSCEPSERQLSYTQSYSHVVSWHGSPRAACRDCVHCPPNTTMDVARLAAVAYARGLARGTQQSKGGKARQGARRCRLRTGRAMGHPPGPRLGAGARAEARHVRPQVAAHSAAHTRLRQPTQRVNLGHRGVEE